MAPLDLKKEAPLGHGGGNWVGNTAGEHSIVL